MSQSFFHIELITTPPECHIIAPPYAVIGSLTEIVFKSNRALSSTCSIYVVDSDGATHSINALLVADSFLFETYFTEYPIGEITIYASVTDTVGNVSSISIKTIELMAGNLLSINLESSNSRSLECHALYREYDVLEDIRNISSYETILTNIQEVEESVRDMRSYETIITNIQEVETGIRNYRVADKVRSVALKRVRIGVPNDG